MNRYMKYLINEQRIVESQLFNAKARTNHIMTRDVKGLRQ